VLGSLLGVQVVDVDEPPENIVLHYNPVREGLSDIIVGILTADDPESRPLTFQINDPSNKFTVSIIFLSCLCVNFVHFFS